MQKRKFSLTLQQEELHASNNFLLKRLDYIFAILVIIVIEIMFNHQKKKVDIKK